MASHELTLMDWQEEVYQALMGLATSLDEHVSKDEVAQRLRALADGLQGVY